MWKIGWVEIYKGTDEEQYRQRERLLAENHMPYRGYEMTPSMKSATVGMPLTQQASSRGPSFNPGGAFTQYAEKNEPSVYSLYIKRLDIKNTTI